MNNKPIPMNCKNFNIHKCPHRSKKLMKDYIARTKGIPDVQVDVTEGFSMAPKVYETFCENCENKNLEDNQADLLE